MVFGPEQEEWKAAILAELQSFAKLGVYEVVSRAGQEEGADCGVWQLSNCTSGRNDIVKDSIISDVKNVAVVGLISGMADRDMGCFDGILVCQVVWG